jgi:hypothetical protein
MPSPASPAAHHKLQVRLDFSDLRRRLDWALAHDQGAHAMADAARRVAHRRLRHQDIQVPATWHARLVIRTHRCLQHRTLGQPSRRGVRT